ncbi:MAG: acetyl-CoA carboxylase biotin carboxyl carrier protein subunit [Acidobacteriota bacterium]
MTDDTPPIRLVVDDTAYETRATPAFASRRRWSPPDPRLVAAHIPGVIRAVYVRPGQAVRWGERLLVLEAMKMQNDVLAPRAGVVKSVRAEVGEMVPRGRLLIELE